MRISDWSSDVCSSDLVRPVGGGDDDDAFIGVKAVHLHQKLVQRLLALVIAVAQPCAAMTSHGVDFVDEDDARRILLRLFEHVAHAGRADADEQIGRAHVCTPVTNAHLVCRLLLEKKKNTTTTHTS